MSEPVIENAADERAVKKRKATAKTAERIAAADLAWLMGDPRGRRWMWAHLGDTHVFHTSFRHGEPVESAVFRDGERNIGVKLLDRLHRICPGLYATMMREAVKEPDDE
jgi:hypothetical protein